MIFVKPSHIIFLKIKVILVHSDGVGSAAGQRGLRGGGQIQTSLGRFSDIVTENFLFHSLVWSSGCDRRLSFGSIYCSVVCIVLPIYIVRLRLRIFICCCGGRSLIIII